MDHLDERDFIRRTAAGIEEWEKTPRSFEDPYSDMTPEEKSKLIILLQKDKAELAKRHEETVKRLDALLKSQEQTNQTLQSLTILLAKRDAEIEDLRRQLAESLKANKDLTDRQKRDDQQRFGKSSQKKSNKSKDREDPPGHAQNKLDFDGTPGSVDETSLPDCGQKESAKQRTLGDLPYDSFHLPALRPLGS